MTPKLTNLRETPRNAFEWELQKKNWSNITKGINYSGTQKKDNVKDTTDFKMDKSEKQRETSVIEASSEVSIS